MPSRPGGRPALLIGLALAAASPAAAHHPGSHAVRGPGGEVRLDLAVQAGDACTTIAEVRPGAPDGLKAPPGAAPVTVRLVRREGAICAAVVTALREARVVAVPGDARVVHLFVVAPGGAVQASERVPIR